MSITISEEQWQRIQAGEVITIGIKYAPGPHSKDKEREDLE